MQQAEVGALMCADPSVNDQFGCENTHLLKEILRDEWKFKGFVQSDYTATDSTINGAATKNAVQAGQLSESVVDTMLIQRFTQMFRFGLFDNPRTPTPIPAESDGLVARLIAEECAVLLKNSNHQLPLDAKVLRSIA